VYHIPTSAMARVALFVQDDSVACLLGTLAARGCEVLCLGASETGAPGCAIFARRAVELGFGFVALGGKAASAGAVVAGFKPDFSIFVPDGAAQPPEAFTNTECSRKFIFRAGRLLPGAPWPEFGPIFEGQAASRVVLETPGGKEEGSAVVALSAIETALTLRAKHAEAMSELLAGLLDGGELPKAALADAAPASSSGMRAPTSIALDWDDAVIERFVRAHFLPPRDAAEITDPATGEAYFIESMTQLQEFRARVLKDTRAGAGTEAAYAADTHWYSNVGGSIVKMGDSDIHMPARVADRKRPAIIPGAALGARKKLRMNEPLIGPNAERYCSAALASSWIGVEGPYVKQFEKHLARICGCNAACAVQSGTAALYGAMKALGVSDPSHLVLVPAFTCAACADAVVHAGGKPIPIDCDMESYGLSLEAVRKALESNKGVVGVVVAPCYGVPARDFLEIYNLCKERGLWLCEDACESYGASQLVVNPAGEQTKVPVGSLATLCVVSVRSEKMVGVGEGGAILGNDTTLVARAKWWCSRAPCRGVGLWRVYEHDAVGQNFRLPEMLAAVGCAAAEMLPVMIERKRAIHSWYEAGFAARKDLQGIRLQKCSPGDEPVWWITAALLPDGMSGEAVGMRLMKDYPDIEIRPGFSPLNTMAIFRSPLVGPCPNAESLYHGLVCLPSSNMLSKPDVERVCDALAHALHAVAAESS